MHKCHVMFSVNSSAPPTRGRTSSWKPALSDRGGKWRNRARRFDQTPYDQIKYVIKVSAHTQTQQPQHNGVKASKLAIANFCFQVIVSMKANLAAAKRTCRADDTVSKS